MSPCGSQSRDPVSSTSARAQAWAATTAGILFFVGRFFTCTFQAVLAVVPGTTRGWADLFLNGPVSLGCGIVLFVSLVVIHNRIPFLAERAHS